MDFYDYQQTLQSKDDLYNHICELHPFVNEIYLDLDICTVRIVNYAPEFTALIQYQLEYIICDKKTSYNYTFVVWKEPDVELLVQRFQQPNSPLNLIYPTWGNVMTLLDEESHTIFLTFRCQFYLYNISSLKLWMTPENCFCAPAKYNLFWKYAERAGVKDKITKELKAKPELWRFAQVFKAQEVALTQNLKGSDVK